MLKRILGCALLAGLIAGGASAMLQQWLVVPVLLEAELYETGEAVHFGGLTDAASETRHDHGAAAAAAGHDHGATAASAGHDHAAGVSPVHEHGPVPGPDAGRVFTTAIATIGVNIGFAAFLVALFYLRGARPTIREGIVWGLCGFAVQVLAPSLGHPPELPGVAAADLEARQLWWLGTIAASAVGVWLIAFVREPWSVPLAIALLVAPHVIGAPHAEGYAGTAPPEIASLWAGRTIGVAAASWAVLGAVAAALWGRFNQTATA